MSVRKKIYTRRGKYEEQKAVDFAWVKVAALQMGMTLEQAGLSYPGQFKDMFEEYKKWHNLRTKKQMFNIDEQEAESSLSELR